MPKIDLGLSPYRQHVENWKNCQRCTLHHGRDRVVLARGKVPADILFIGEGPGQSEDTLGVPFVGPAGRLLDSIVGMALEAIQDERQADGKDQLRWCFTNVVACMPTDEDGNKSGAPEAQEIKSCRPRLEEFIGIVRPRMLVAVGDVAHKNLSGVIGSRLYCHIVHPSHILSRLPYVQRDFAARRAAVVINNEAAKL